MAEIDLNKPDFSHQLDLGMIGACFGMRNGYSLAVLTNGDPFDMSTSVKYPVFFLKDLLRDEDFEKRLFARMKSTGLVDIEELRLRFGCTDRILKVAPPDINAVFLAAMALC
jgi:hypothetical protein